MLNRKIKKRDSEAAWRRKNPRQFYAIVNRSRLKTEYGITPERVDAMLLAQHNRCLICQRFMGPRGTRSGEHMVIDHDHESGEVRGLLCNHCNQALGLFRHDSDILTRASWYIKHWNDMFRELDSDGTGSK